MGDIGATIIIIIGGSLNEDSKKEPENEDKKESKTVKFNIGKTLLRSALDAASKVLEIIKRELD